MKLKLGELVLLFGKMSFLIKIEERTLSNQFGQIDMRELLEKKFGDTIKTHKGEEFHILKPGILDFLRFDAKRGPQVITPKDFATILSLTMPPKDAKIIEAGTGSGFLTMLFASTYPNAQIHTFERRKDFFDNSKKNFDALGLKNVFPKNQDILEGTDEKDADLAILDMEDSENAVPIAHKALKIGGYLVIYAPFIEQTKACVQNMESLGFIGIHTIETIQREWDVRRHTLPKRSGVMHTGFVSVGRKS